MLMVVAEASAPDPEQQTECSMMTKAPTNLLT